MQTQEIANRLVAYCRKGDWDAAQTELYDQNAISIEPYAGNGFEKETRGLSAIVEKGKKFDSHMEQVHSIEVSEPLVAGNTIAFTMTMDLTPKGGKRSKNPELCVYQVKNGKIVSEEFFV